jgi:hypothetical protein
MFDNGHFAIFHAAQHQVWGLTAAGQTPVRRGSAQPLDGFEHGQV